jgi:hypothetical protein
MSRKCWEGDRWSPTSVRSILTTPLGHYRTLDGFE